MTVIESRSDNQAAEAEAELAERAAPCTPGYRVTFGKCFRTYCNSRIFPSEADEVITSTPCTTIQIGIRKCARDPDCDYVNFDNNTKRCTLIAEEGEGFGVQNGVPRYNAGALVPLDFCN